VTTGQRIALLGNSGHATAPNLYFGLLDAPNSATGNGVPMVLGRYELVGTTDPDVLTAATPLPDGRLTIAASAQSAQTDTLPLSDRRHLPLSRRRQRPQPELGCLRKGPAC
jgi:murein DD-endopeptidase MepM/ murein hydrolase activator NlpD